MSRNVLFLSPGYPAEMPFFVRGLSEVGAKVLGLGDQAKDALPAMAREHLAFHQQVRSLWDEETVIAAVLDLARRVRIEQVECLWEPGMILAARLREALHLPGMTVEQTVPFRDKEKMKQVLDRAGIRTPRHTSTSSEAGVRRAAEEIGYPIIVKPISGAGSLDTHRCDGPADLERVLPQVRHVQEVSVEEFIDGEEFTFDTVCAGGRLLFENVCWYRPRPLVQKQVEWVSPQSIGIRDLDQEELLGGRKMGREVLTALGFATGFTHMEWFRKSDGEVVFGEIGGRPPGARMVDVMNFVCDADLFTGWAEAVVHGRIERQRLERKYNVAMVFKRAQGIGRIQRVEGLDRILADFGSFVRVVELLPVGAPRRNWKNTVISDGFVVVRHPELQALLHMADRLANDLHLYAG
jgi:biotin carboxylase